MQIVVLDKLDYCASLHNLETTQNKPNFKVSSLTSLNSKQQTISQVVPTFVVMLNRQV